MAKYTNLKGLFTAIANAIRSKEGSTGKIVADDFPDRIAAIQTHDTTIEDALITGYGLTEYTNNRVSNIGAMRFYAEFTISMSPLKKVRFDNVIRIGQEAFYNCGSLMEIVFPNVETIEARAFLDCIRLKEVVFNKLIKICNYAFSGCNNLARVDINAAFIEENAFRGCFNLNTFIVRCTDESPTSINTNVFEGTPIAYGTGYIYFYRSEVDKYKATDGWSTYASQIRAIEDYPEITGG